jgi:hypothetical protein
VVRRLTENATCWHNRAPKPLVQKRSQILQRSCSTRKLGEKKPCSPARKTCQMMTDACRNLPVASCPRATHRKSKTPPKSAQNASFHSVRKPRQPGQRDIRGSSKHVLLRTVAPVSQGYALYANNGTYNRPALVLFKVNVCVVGGFPFNLVLLTRTRMLITIDQPVAPVAMQTGFSSCIAAKVCFRDVP